MSQTRRSKKIWVYWGGGVRGVKVDGMDGGVWRFARNKEFRERQTEGEGRKGGKLFHYTHPKRKVYDITSDFPVYPSVTPFHFEHPSVTDDKSKLYRTQYPPLTGGVRIGLNGNLIVAICYSLP